MKKIFLTALLIAYNLLPTAGQAATAGFAPATGLWFSQTEFTPQETLAIYAVVVNNTYPAFSGTVGFYDNEEIIDTVEVARLQKEEARLIKAAWTPAAGEHRLAARFLKAFAWDAKGASQPLAAAEIASLVVGNATAPGEDSAALPAAAVVQVRGEGGQLVIAPATEAEAVRPSWLARLTKPIEDLFGKNRAALDRAEGIAGTVTTTAAKVSGAVEKTQATVAQGRAYYEQGKSQLGRVRPYWERATAVGRQLQPAWDRLSGHNDPKRIALAIGTIIIGYWVGRWLWRRRDYDELQNY